jgi:uncharacterized membrane protein
VFVIGVNLSKYLKSALLLILLLIIIQPLFANALADKTVFWLKSNGFSPVLIVLIISMIPIIELRGSIPIAILLFKMPWPEAVLLSVLGNMIPIPFILLLMDWFFALISRSQWGARFTSWIFARTRRKGKAIERYEAIGLTIFVGIPLPGTGAWTGAFAANIFGISFWKSMLYIFIGVLIAAVIVTALSLMGNLAIG